jgi:hypothetical protein
VKEVVDTRTEFGFDDAGDLWKRQRIDVIVQRREFVDVRFREEVGTRGENLAELDVGRPEFDEPLPECAGLVRDFTPVAVKPDVRVREGSKALVPGEVGESVSGEEPDR